MADEVADSQHGEQLLGAIVGQRFDELASLFTTGARLRALIPGGPIEQHGRAAVADQFARWFGAATDLVVADQTVAAVAGRFHLAYRLLVTEPADDGTPQRLVVAQQIFGDAGDDGIEAIDLLCSGFLPDAAPAEATVHRFDAGAMGCTDGLAQEFRRRIRSIPVGDVLEVVARDPAAKADLPPLARMMGHNVQTIEDPGDGRLIFRTERVK